MALKWKGRGQLHTELLLFGVDTGPYCVTIPTGTISVAPKLGTYFLVGHKTDRLIPNKEDALSLKEMERSTTCMFTHECKDMLWSTSKGTLRKMQYHQNGPHLMNTSSNKLLNKKPPLPQADKQNVFRSMENKTEPLMSRQMCLALSKGQVKRNARPPRMVSITCSTNAPEGTHSKRWKKNLEWLEKWILFIYSLVKLRGSC